jgi:uncharacterized protein (DUF1800 family)
MDPKLRALNRFGMGARAGERDTIGDPRDWLRSQLAGGAPRLDDRSIPGDADIGAALRALRMAAGGGGDPQRARQEARRRLTQIAAAEARAALNARVTSTRPFVERLVAFWSNHLCVSSAGKVPVAALAGSYERDVIRAHVLGRFENMVLASAKHPAMLLYLDNAQSIGPNSRAATMVRRRRGAQRGLNENYARELLELHTLGVDGGYAQSDVLELARLLTGWTVDRAGAMAFTFEAPLHEPGNKTVLGARYGTGLQEGEKAIRALCRHPSAARFVARKLVSHFVADDPPASAVDRIAAVFGQSNGDLRAVATALVELPEAWDDSSRKFRAPQDWLVATLRAFRADDSGAALAPVLRQLRHPLWAPPSPKGFPDSAQDWADPDSLMNRAELARSIARRVPPRVDTRALATVIDIDAGDALVSMLADGSIPAQDRVALAIAGPAFQWR